MKSVCVSDPLYLSVPSPIPFPKKPPLDIPSIDFAACAPCVPVSGLKKEKFYFLCNQI